MDRNITTEVKINYIYETLKKQESRRKWTIAGKWIFRIALVAYMYYFITHMLPVITDNMIEKITPEIPGIAEMDLNKEELIKKGKEIFGY